MADVSFGGLLVVVAIAVAAPLLVGFLPALRVPAVVLEILGGIAVGPEGLGWVEIDLPIEILSLVGLAFLLFLAGTEIDVHRLRGGLLERAGLGHALSGALCVVAALLFTATGVVDSPALLAVALSATSLGLVVAVLKDAGQAESEVGQLTIAAGSVADFVGIVLLSLLFSMTAGGTGARLILLGGFLVLVVAATLALSRLGRSAGLEAVLVRLQDTTAEIRVRIAVLVMVAFVFLAGRFGLETILGAFLAGAIFNLVDRDTVTHPHLRLKLDALGYGFLIPIFFVSSGLRFDLGSLFEDASALVRVPLFLLAILVVRGVPAVLYISTVGRRAAVAAGLLQATTLPFLVTATEIGVRTGELSAANGAALLAAGLLSVVIFPLVAVGLLEPEGGSEERPSDPGARPRATATSRAETPSSP